MSRIFVKRDVDVRTVPFKRYGKFPIDKIRDMYENRSSNIVSFGKAGLIFNFNHVNYKTFFRLGCNCSVCGLEGKFFIIGQFVDRVPSRKATHQFFLFGVDEDGNEIEISHQRGTNHIHPPICAKCIDSTKELIR